MYNQSNHPINVQPTCVVGIGASAGGLEALQQFLTFLPSNTGMAFVIIQHLAPNHKSLLADILGKYSAMQVAEITDGMLLERNRIYMIPPKYQVELEKNVLRLREHDPEKINHPIDVFFRSLADSYENRSVAVILSGTGSDGTNGIRSIKEQNGMIIVQAPESAKFDGMPRNAIATGFADLVQTPDAIAKEMGHIAHSMVDANSKLELSDEDLLSQVFSILKNVTNINYAYYKQTTILRRIERRLVVTHNRNLRGYVTYLNNNPEEAKLLAKEVLIGVTSFFRDPDYFDLLKEMVIKRLIRESPASKQLRIWVAGCSTGEEAYSVAILFAEAMEELGIRRDIKIFATDLDGDSINTAVRGMYGDNIIEDVSVTRLSKYFNRKGNKYVIRHDIRKMIIFAQHNVFQDPPFGKLDLICCRNVLIYFQTILQRNLFAIFHVALSDQGFLFLGRSESVMDYDDIFRVVAGNEKIFVHNSTGKAPAHEHFSYSLQNVESMMEPFSPFEMAAEEAEDKYQDMELDNRVLENMMPACVLVNEKNELTRSYGDCSRILSVPVGKATQDIFMLVRDDLKIALSTALRESKEKDTRVGYQDVPVQLEEEPEYISVVAEPVRDVRGQSTGFTAVAFIRGNQEQPGDMKQYEVDNAASRRISDLEHELRLTKDNLRQTVTELESVNAELQAANEELLTANEELQSSNEELQSVNEELYTVNSEYQSKVTELGSVNDDMANFLATTLVGVLMVDRDLNIRKYTEYISSEFNVAEQDVGRSLRYITYHFGTIDLMQRCREVLETEVTVEEHCASVVGKTYLIRIAPYRSYVDTAEDYELREGKKRREHHVSGLVISFVDTTKQVDDQEQIEEMAKALRQAVRTGEEKQRFLSQMSHDMRTPMTAIYGLTQLALQKDPSEAVRDNLEKILSSSEYMIALIEEILETSRIDAGKVVIVPSAVKEDAVLKSVVSIIKEQAQSADLEFTVDIRGSDSRYIMMDQKHVERALLNLLSNALHFTPAGGTIRFTANAVSTKGRVEYTYRIRDNGIGITEDFQKRMFLPFEQSRGGEEYHDGTGLGLYICKNLIELMGGSISCASSVGEGTEFVVHLSYPFATDEQITMQSRRVESFEDQILYGKNVLLVEDNKINAEVEMEILQTKGIHSELARDGQEAVEIFVTRGPDHFQAILMDLMMPVMDGYEATRRIRQSQTPDAKTIPIFALTADVTEEAEKHCYDVGFTACIPKPIDHENLFMHLVKEFE